ncbi:hypothetical protein GCM10023085_81320 [Actinomadura viridis]
MLTPPLLPLAAMPAQAAPDGISVADTQDAIVVKGLTYRMTIRKEGFRYSFSRPDGTTLVPAHAESGLRIKETGAADFADAVRARLVGGGRVAVLDVDLENGSRVRVRVHPSAANVRLSVDPSQGGAATMDLRTGPVGPSYGLGDYGAHADGQPDQGTPCSRQVVARPTAELTGITLDNLTNEGSCKRFISNFVVFPRQRFAEVLFDEGRKRVGLNGSENRLGVTGTRGVDGLYYFFGGDLRQVYADYRAARHRHGYVDARPRARMFELGWEAYGALAWDTYQSSVTATVQAFREHGYPLGWGVVGSGFWPGPRGDKIEGTTNSFGMWDSTAEPGRDDGLPNPRYPDPGALKSLFRENGMALLLGARNNFKAPPSDGGNHTPLYDGPFVTEALSKGYLLTGADGRPVKVTRAQFPRDVSYVLDGENKEAVAWYVEQMRKWGVDGWKEDTMLYDPDLYRDANWNAVQKALHDAGDYVMVRNAAYSLPGDWVRINDTIFGRGEVFHEDPDRVPVNMLNIAATGHGAVYPDFIGGTPKLPMTDPAYQKYFVRNAQLSALTPIMAFGKGPWELGDDRLADAVKRMALWHSALTPYIYDAVLDGHRTGFPYAMTPLPLAYPDDENTYGLVNDRTRQYQWLLGESLLAAPVFGADFETAQGRDVYLPEGTWIDYETGATFQGPTTLKDYRMDMTRIPAFVGGKGVLVTRDGGGLRAQVYPIRTQSTYEYGEGGQRSRIVNANAGWNAATLTVTDTTTGDRVRFTVDGTTGAIGFPMRAGHDYRLTGGGR